MDKILEQLKFISDDIDRLFCIQFGDYDDTAARAIMTGELLKINYVLKRLLNGTKSEDNSKNGD